MYTDKFTVNIPPRWGVKGCFIFAVLFAVTSARDINILDTNTIPVGRSEPTQQCAGYCKEGSKFSLKPGSSYVYDYQALIKSSVTGTSNDISRLLLTAKAEVYISSPCELILQLTNVKLEDSGNLDNVVTTNRQEEFTSALQSHSLRFSFQDGVIDQLCPSEDEADWALNIKRGILSSLQNSMKYISEPYTHLYEVDVNGICETIYRSQPDMSNMQLVEKHKNLMQCIGQGKQSLMFPGVFSANDQTKSAPLIRSEQTCLQAFHESGYMSKSTCIEVHQFTPFSNRDSGVNTRIVQKLELHDIVDNSLAPEIDKFVNVRTNLKFNYSSENAHESTSDELVALTLEKLTTHTENGVTKDVPHLFTLLVDQLKGFSYYQLTKVFTERKDQRSHKFLLNAMPLVGTVDSVLIMQDLFTSGDLNQDEIDTWLTSLLFYKKPTLQLLDAVKYFLADEKNTKSVLTISSMVHSYCTLDEDCRDKHEIIEITNIIQNRLGDSCHTENKEEQDNMIVTLKAVGNAGIYTKSLDTLSACYKNTLNPIEVRLAAVSAFRRFSCKDVSKSFIIDLFYDQKQDVELRIAGYLAAMQCPTVDIVEKVVDLLYSDETFHVKSFVWTHLTNLKETSSQWRKDIFHILQEYKLPENMTNEARFYSRNFENSVFNENLDVGATLDSNVVYSTHSYLPRSATLNLTLDLFGEAINVFEIGTRLEGFEDLIEDFFSKTGVFPEESLRGILRNMRNASSDNEITSDIRKHSNKFKEQKSFLEKPPRGSMFARIFGHELYLKQFYGLNELLKKDKLLTNLFYGNTENIFDGNNLDYTNSVVFLDSNYIIPTIVGLPLSIKINGTTTVGLKLKAEADLKDLRKTESGKIEFHLNPSATVQIVGSMTIDAKVTSSGIKSINTLNTNTYMDTKVTMENGALDVYVNLPREQMEVFDVSSNLFVIHHDKLEEIKGIEENIEKWDTCSGHRVTTISGLRLCSQLTLRNASQRELAPYFPFTGSFKYAVLLQKSDTFSAYHFQLMKVTTFKSDRMENEISVLFDTPGSTMNRAMKAKLKVGPNSASLLLDSPAASLELSGKYQKSELELQAIVNKKKMFSLLLALRNLGYGRYTPLINMYIDDYINVTVEGSAIIVPGSKYSTDLQITGITRDPITFSGSLNGQDGHYNLGLVAQAPLADVKLRGDVRFTKTSFTTKAMLDYSLNNTPPTSFDAAIKLHAHKKGGLYKYGLVTSMQGTKFSSYNTKLSWMLYQTENYFDCNTNLKVGKTEWNAQQMYHNYKLANGDSDFAVKFTLSSPPKKLDYRIEYQFINTQSRTFVFGLAQLNEQQRFITNFDMHVKASNDKRLSLELSNPWRGVYFNAHLEPKHENILWMNITTGLTENQQKYMELNYWSIIKFYGTEKQNVDVMGELGNFNVWNMLTWYFHVTHEQSRSACRTLLQINNFSDISSNWFLMYNESHIEVDGNVDVSGKSYSGSLYFESTEQLLKLTTSLNLERKILFRIESSQKDQTYLSELKLFWDEGRDNSQSLNMSFKSTDGTQQKAFIMMPDHYGAFDIKYLNEGLSSVNLTAIWGVNKDSATNAIMLSTAWLLSDTGLTSTALLTTPFVGFERQAVGLKLSLSENPYAVKNEFKTGLEWQDQKVDIGLSWQILDSDINILFNINGTLEMLKNLTLYIDHHISLSDFYSSTSKIQASYNSIENIKLQTMIFTKGNHKQLSVLFTSPFQNYEEIYLNVMKKDKQFKLVKTWAKDKTITLSYSYDLPYRASVNFTSPFEGYNIASVDYIIDSSGPISVVFIKGFLSESYAACKIKGFQMREVDQRRQMLSQIISAQIETEGNYMLPLFVANITHKVDRLKVSTDFFLKNNESILLGLNFFGEYENKLVKTVAVNVNTRKDKLSGKFIQNIDSEQHNVYDYKFEGFWNEENLKTALFSDFNTLHTFVTFNASSTLWNNDFKIWFLSDLQYLGQHTTLEISLPSSGHQSSPSVLKVDFSKFSFNTISADVLITSPFIDTFKATYKYSMLTETSHTQKVDIVYMKDKNIVIDFIINNGKNRKFTNLLVHTTLYKDIALSAEYTEEEDFKLLLQALLGDEKYTAAGMLHGSYKDAKAHILVETPKAKILETELNFGVGCKEWSSDMLVSFFGSTTYLKMFVNWVKEDEMSCEPVIHKILFEPKTVSFSLFDGKNRVEIELIDEVDSVNSNRNLHISTKLNDEQFTSVLKCIYLSNHHSLYAVHKHNTSTVFMVNTETKFDSESISLSSIVETPYENWKYLRLHHRYSKTNNTQHVIMRFEKNELTYELKGIMNISKNMLALNAQFNIPDTNLTFYSKYNANENYSLYIYAVYNEEVIQGLTTLSLYKDYDQLKEGWKLESDCSRNGKHYKLNSSLDLDVYYVSDLDEFVKSFKLFKNLHETTLLYSCKYYTKFYFDLNSDNVSHSINYYSRIDEFTENKEYFTNISLPYFSEFKLNLNASNQNLSLENGLFKKELHITASAGAYNCNLTGLAQIDKMSIAFSSNIKNWENLNTLAEFINRTYKFSVIRNGEDKAELLFSPCLFSQCATGNITVLKSGFMYTIDANYDISRPKHYEFGAEYNLNGQSKRFGASFRFNVNETNINILTPFKGYEDLKLTGTYTNINNIFVLEQNNQKILSASIMKLDTGMLLTISAFTEKFEYMNITLDMKGMLNEIDKDKTISIQIMKKGMKIVDFSLAVFLYNKIGIESHLYSTALSTFNNIKFIASIEFLKAVLYIRVNQPLIDIVGMMEDGKISLSTPLGFTVFQLTSIQANYDTIDQGKSFILEIESKNHLPYTVSANFSNNNDLFEVNIVFNTENTIDINECHFYFVYSYKPEQTVNLRTLFDINANNYLDISINKNTFLKANVSCKVSQPNLISTSPFINLYFNYNLLLWKKNTVEFDVKFNDFVYEFSGLLERLDTFLEARVCLYTNGVNYVFPGFNTSSYSASVVLQYKDSVKFVTLDYKTNNTIYKLNLTSASPKHLELSVRSEKRSLLDYFNLKYDFMNNNIFNLKTKYNKYNVHINCAFDNLNGTLSFLHQDEDMLNKFELIYNPVKKISLLVILKNQKYFDVLIIKDLKDREIKVNIGNIWALNLIELHMQNYLYTLQNFKWTVALINGNYRSSGEIHIPRNNLYSLRDIMKFNNTLDVFESERETQNKFHFTSGLTLKNSKYYWLEIFLSKDSKFVAKMMEDKINQLFFIEAQTSCDRYSKRFCEEKHSYVNIHGLTKEPLYIYYQQKFTNYEKSFLLSYNVRGAENSVLIQMPLKATDRIQMEWKNTLFNQIHVQFKFLKLNYLSVSVVFEDKLFKLLLRNTEIMMYFGQETINIKYFPLQVNNCSISFKSTFDILKDFSLSYNQSDARIFVDFYILSDKYNTEWKGNLFEERNKYFNVSFTDLKNKFSFNCQRLVVNRHGNVSIFSLFTVDNNGDAQTVGAFDYLKDGNKIKTNLDIDIQNYSLTLNLESSDDRDFNELKIQCNTPHAENYLFTQLNFTRTDCILHQVVHHKPKNMSVQKGEVIWKFIRYMDYDKAQFKTKTGMKTFLTSYEMYNSTILVKSPWLNLEETGLIVGKNREQNSVVVKLFSGLQLIEIVNSLIFEEESVFCSVRINIEADFAWRGLNYLIGYYDKITNELKFEFDSPLINHEHVLFSFSQYEKDFSKSYDMVFQKKHVDLIKLTVNTSVKERNLQVSGSFLEHTTIDCVLQEENNKFISSITIILFNEKFVNASLHCIKGENNWNIVFKVDKFAKLSNLTAQIEHIVGMFMLRVEHELIDAHLKINNNEEGVKSQLLIDSNIVKRVSLDAVSVLRIMETTDCHTNITLYVSNKLYIVNSTFSATINNIHLVINCSSSKDNIFNIGGLITKKDGNHIVYVYANNNNFTGKLLNENNSVLNVSLEFCIPDVNINGSFNFHGKVSPIFEVMILYNFFGKTNSLQIKAEKQSSSFQSLAEIRTDNNSHLIKLNVSWDHIYFIELDYIDDKLQMYRSLLNASVNVELFQLVVFIQNPAVKQIDFETIYFMQSNELQIRFNDRIKLLADLNKNHFGFVLHTGQTEYKFEYRMKESEYYINISSPFISTENQFLLGEESFRGDSRSIYRGAILVAGLHIKSKNFLNVVLELKNEQNDVAYINLLFNKNNNIFEVSGLCHLAQSINKLNFTHNLLFPRDTHLSISSPLLSNGIIEAGITSKDSSMLLLLRLGQTHLKLGARFDPEDGIKIDIQAPIFSQMNTVTIHGVFLRKFNVHLNEVSKFKVGASIAFTSNNVLLSQASIKFDFDNLSHLEMSVIMKTKTKQIDDVEMFVHIPLDLYAPFFTQLSLTVAKVEPVFFYHVWTKKQLNTTLKFYGQSFVESAIDETIRNVLTWDLNILNFKCDLKRSESGNIISVMHGNKKLVNLTYVQINSDNFTKFTLELKSPIKGHEKYGIKYEMKNSEHKQFMFLLSMPKIGADVGFDMEYFFNNFTHNMFTVKFHLPFIVPGKQSYGVSFLNHINLEMKKIDIDYYVHIGKFLKTFSLFLEAGKNNLHLNGRGQLNDKIIFLNMNIDIYSSKVQLYTDVGTPLDSLNDARLQVTLNRALIGSEVQLSYNSKIITEIRITENENKLNHFEMKIIETSVSFSYLYNAGTKYNILCWNLTTNGSPMCIELTTKLENELNYYLDIKFIVGSTVTEFECSRMHYFDDLEYFAYLSWENKRTFGFKFQREYSGNYVDEYLKYNSLQIVLPECTIESSSIILRTDIVSKAKFEFKWDANNNSEKKIGVESLSELEGDMLMNTLTFNHFALQHDFIIKSQSNKNQLKFIVQYSDKEKELFEIGISYWDFIEVNKETAGVKLYIEHKATNTFIQLLGNSTVTPAEITSCVQMCYTNSTLNTIKYVDVFGGLDFEKQKLAVNLASNGNSFAASGSLWNKNNGFHGITVETRLNQKEPIRFEVGINTNPLELEMELNHGLSQTYVTYFGMPSNKEITGKIFHTLNGYKNRDAFITLKLNTTKLLWGRFEFNTAMFANLHNILFVEYSDADIIFSELLKGVVKFYQEELINSSSLLGESLSEKVNNILTVSSSELCQVLNYSTNFGVILSNMYKENYFYVQTTHQTLQFIWRFILYSTRDKVDSAIGQIVWAVNTVFQATEQMFLQILNHLNMKLSDLVSLLPDFKVLEQNFTNYTHELFDNVNSLKTKTTENFRQLVKQTCGMFNTLHREIFVTLTVTEMKINNFTTQVVFLVKTHVYNTIVEWVDMVDTAARTLLHVTSDMADIVGEGVMNIKEIRQLEALCSEIKLWVESILDADYLFSVFQDFINDTVELVQADINKNFKEYKIYVEKIVGLITDKYLEVLQQPAVQSFIVRINNIYHKAVWVCNYFGLSDPDSTFWNRVLDIKSDNLPTGLLEVEQRKEYLYSSKYIFDSSKNSFEFYQRLPFEWRGFDELPNMTNIEAGINQYIKESEDKSSPKESMFLNMVHDWVNNVSDDDSNDDDGDDDDLLNQTRGVSAMVAGNTIVTFDGSSYAFAGACNYTLAGDLMTDSFSIILNYEVKDNVVKKKSLTILTANSSVEIDWDYSVTVNGYKLDLPVEIDSSTVIQRRVNEIVMHSLFGYTIECDFEVDICTFTLSLYNFGKTGGLLGTYNNHNFDDLTSPDGKVLELNEFVNSWVVGDSEEFDQCGTKLERVLNEEDRAEFSECEMYFASAESVLSKCFGSVDPRAFYQMCRSNLAYEKRPDRAMFMVISAYINKCRHEGITLSWPTKYSTCTKEPHGIPYEIGTASINEDISRSADIVFVVERAICTMTSNLSNIVTKLETVLKANKIRDNRFAVISFNDQILSTPHVKTVSDEIWTQKAKDIQNMLTSKPTNNIPASEPVPTYEALNFASSLPFRIGVSKTIILISCDSCGNEEFYNELTTMLLKKDIKLHILQSNAITGLNGKAKTVFGADIKGAYTQRNVKSLSPSLPLLKKVLLPKDLCTPVALDTNGTVFNLDLNKKMLDVWSRVVVKSLEPKNCQINHCVQQKNGLGIFISESCSSSGISEADIIEKKNVLLEYSDSGSINMEYIDYSKR